MKEKRRYQDRREYILRAVIKRRKALRKRAVEYLGGKCDECGYSRCIEALDFHHLRDKSFGISQGGFTRSWTAIEEELQKCILLCANCHREIHASKLQRSVETLD